MNPKLERKKQYRRKKRVRAKIFGTKDYPRLSVFRSNRHIWCQLIDDVGGKTIATASDKELKIIDSKRQGTSEGEKKTKKSLVADVKTKTNTAYEVGRLIAKKASEKGIKKVIFCRGGYKYHGRVKALAEGARKGGLKF